MAEGEHPRLDELLHNWARYMRSGGLEELDCKAADFWASGSSDFDGMVATADMNDAIATKAAIDDLVRIEQIAICHFHLAAVFKANREPIEVVYLRARVSVSVGLRKRQVC